MEREDEGVEMETIDMDPGKGDCCGGDDLAVTEGGVPDRDEVMQYYEEAAASPKASLCCPTSYREEDVAHIPEEVQAISYGCGSPVARAGVRPGETVVDLGSGGGIDCFIAAKAVGASGKVIGVDMTDAMLDKARSNARAVSERLGYANVEFRKGYLEAIPIADNTADLVTSNCVINLSIDKKRVFSEMARILKSGGRFVVSDIISDGPVPMSLRNDVERWGECIAGALTREEFLDAAVSAGFHGVEFVTDYLWKVVGGIGFHSVTFRGSAFEKMRDCVFIGQTATYRGPFASATDDEGHIFSRGIAVEICTDTANQLSAAPYRGLFEVSGAETEAMNADGNGPDGCGPACC